MEINLESKKEEMITRLQQLGVADVNPSLNKKDLFAMIQKAENTSSTRNPLLNTTNSSTGQAPTALTPTPQGTDTQLILNAISGLANRIEGVERDIVKMKDNGKNAFMLDAKSEDVESASKSKENVDPRLVSIVEKTLGIDFGVRVESYKDKPGLLFTVQVPQRLSHVPKSFHPVVDKETGKYKLDKDNRVIEEEYWPGDPRSVNLGSTDSFDVVQSHCNKVRSFIVAYYAKMSKPLPEFKLKN